MPPAMAGAGSSRTEWKVRLDMGGEDFIVKGKGEKECARM